MAMPEPCERTQFNHELERRALRVLDPADSTLAWIFHGRNGHTRHGVLVQLGHIAELQGDEACLRMARAVCTAPHPATTREAAAKLRRYRLGLPEPAPAHGPAEDEDLGIALCITLDEYLDEHPDLARAIIDATVAAFADNMATH